MPNTTVLSTVSSKTCNRFKNSLTTKPGAAPVSRKWEGKMMIGMESRPQILENALLNTMILFEKSLLKSNVL